MASRTEGIIRELIADLYNARIMMNVARDVFMHRIAEGAMPHCAETAQPAMEQRSQRQSRLRGPHGEAMRIRQSAALQSGTADTSCRCPKNADRFDLKNGRATRKAKSAMSPLCLFGWHPETDDAIADHRNVEQWQFFVVPEVDLPAGQATISVAELKELSGPITIDHLRASLTEASDEIAEMAGRPDQARADADRARAVSRKHAPTPPATRPASF